MIMRTLVGATVRCLRWSHVGGSASGGNEIPREVQRQATIYFVPMLVGIFDRLTYSVDRLTAIMMNGYHVNMSTCQLATVRLLWS